jgi:NADPH:quinone reductase-like Zn-dependent oxidoreductase
MRAAKKTADNRLYLTEVPAPVPTEGEVLVNVQAISLNFGDVKYAGLGRRRHYRPNDRRRPAGRHAGGDLCLERGLG